MCNPITFNCNRAQLLPEFAAELERDKHRADFLAAWARKTWDEPLEEAFRASWAQLGNEGRTFKAMRPNLPQWRVTSSQERDDWQVFYRSDHASFWFPANSTTTTTTTTTKIAGQRTMPSALRRRSSVNLRPSLNAILLTDLGPWRNSYRHCYHSACDDKRFLTDSNLAFMQQVVDSLLLTLVRLGQGQCAKSLVATTTTSNRSAHQRSSWTSNANATSIISELEAESFESTTTTTSKTNPTIAP